MQQAIVSTTSVLYFAYGSNLLAQRIHINNPSAVRIGVGKLNGYRLDFNGFSKLWQGCPSTVVPEAEEHVWGAVWRLNVTDLDNLDCQEGVPTKYLPFNPQIVMLDGQSITCRCYLMVNQPTKQVPLPLERRPSIAYIETILHGAKESELPEDYLKVLNNIPHNNNIGPDMPWLKQLPTTEL